MQDIARTPEKKSYWRETYFLRGFAWLKIPLLFYVLPSVVELNERRCVIKIPLRRRTKNHLNSMYFGALCIGADGAGGLMAMKLIDDSGRKISLIFKDFQAQFFARAEGDVFFTCEDGEKIQALVQRTLASSERQNETVVVVATTPKQRGDEPVARFELTLSLKRRD